MTPKSIFFLGGGHGGAAALRSLLDRFPSLEIVADDAEIRSMARPDDILRSSIEETVAPLGVMAGHLDLLDQEILARKTVLNVHYSLLPKYRGLHSLAWAMLNCERELGWSVHIVNEFIDDGPLVHQRARSYAGETSQELMAAFDREVEQDLGAVVLKFLSGEITPTPQDKAAATWAPRRSREDCLVDYHWPAERLRAFFKVLAPPYPRPFIRVAGTAYEIVEARIEDRSYFCTVGKVVNVDDEGAWIKCHDSLLVVKYLIGPSGRLDARELLRIGHDLRNRDFK